MKGGQRKPGKREGKRLPAKGAGRGTVGASCHRGKQKAEEGFITKNPSS